ncbi:hypothetical protein Leryth_006914, partial [Lithospermum erythrorhizon]
GILYSNCKDLGVCHSYKQDGQSQPGRNTHLTSKIGNSTNMTPQSAHLGFPVSGDISNTTLNSVATSSPSMGASSLVTDANSGLSGGPQFQRNASFNNESYLRLPASPLSFSSNNISISGSSVIDGSSVVQQSSNQDLSSQQVQQRHQHQVTSSATSHIGQMELPNGSRYLGSFMQDSVMSQLQKKPRLDIKQEDVLQQQVLQQYIQRQDPMHLQRPNPQLQALYQKERLRQQQQQLLQSIPPMQRAKLLQQHQQQLQLRQHIQQHSLQPSPTVKHPYDGGVCSRRIMQFLYHQRQRPPDNSIAYWRKFVAEYYSPRAKKRWCLSQYDNVSNQSLGIFPQSAMGASQCDICGSKSGRGYEATFEVLARLNEIKFGSGVVDELLYLNLPRECRMPSGMMMLEYEKAVQESVYEQLRVVREGQLRIIFTTDLKILTWEFCARRHEELLPRRVIAPQVNQILQVAQKCQSTISESGPDGISQQDMQNNNNMVMAAGRQLAKTFESQSLNDLGFWKRYVRCLQIAEVVNSMKDLMDFCKDQKVGPIEALQNFPSHATSSNMNAQKMQEMDQHGGMQGLPTDWNTHNKLMATHPGLANNQSVVGRGVMNGSAQASLALTDYQNLLMRQSSMNSNSIQQEASPSFLKSSPSSSSSFQGSGGVLHGNLMNMPISSISNPHLQQQRLPSSSGLIQQNPQNSNGNQLQQQMMQQLLQDMSNNNNRNAVQQQSVSGHSGSLSRDGLTFSSGTPVASVATRNGPGNSVPHVPSRNNSFKSVSNSESLAGASNAGFNYKAPDAAQNFHLSDEMLQNMHGFFNNDIDDNINYGWKV